MALVSTAVTATPGTITGTVRGPDDMPASNTIVVVCSSTGVPIDARTCRAMTAETLQENAPPPLFHAVTDPDGVFRIDAVPEGAYRIVAQSWPQRDGPPASPFEVNGAVVQLHGTADVVVPSPEAERVELRPAGSASASIDLEFGNDQTLLVVSTAPLRADPVLGVAAWSGDFARSIVAANRMPKGRTTLRGLPEGTIHLAVLAADNNPGFGAVSIDAGRAGHQDVAVDIVAGWSDARHDPPARLEPLTAQLRALGTQRRETILRAQLPELNDPAGVKHPSHRWAATAAVLDRSIELDGQTIPAADWLAAEEYIRLQDRLNQLGDVSARTPKRDDTVSYEATLRDLHEELARRYPAFALKRIDWDAVGRELLPRAATIEDDRAFGLLCLELVARLEDNHAVLLDGAAEVPTPPLPRYDPGLVCLEDDRGAPVVYRVDAGGPAASAGVQPGATILAIDDLPASDAVTETMSAMRRFDGCSSDRNLRYHAFRALLRRLERGARLQLLLRGVDGNERSVMLTADLDARYLPRLPVPIDGIHDGGSVSWKMLDDEIGYIYVRRIRDDLIPSLDRAVTELREAGGLIIDVRGNSGGGFDGRRSHLNFDPVRRNEEPERPRFVGPIAVLIDARCVSAGEGWASWFVATQRARLFGQTTAGASARKTVYTLRNGMYKVRFPVKLYTGFLDRPIERRGLEPDVPLMPAATDIAAGRDTVLEAARAYLRGES